MRENTPPHSPLHNLEEELLDDEDGEMIYLGDADELENALENEDSDLEGENDEFMPNVPIRDDSHFSFDKHTAPVFSCSIHPTENLAATGGEDDKAYVWNMDTGDVVFEVEGHKDTVISASFSYDGTFFATGDMAGDLKVFRVAQNYKKIWEFSMGDMCWMKWHIASNVLLAGSDTGEIYVWRIPSGDCKIMPGTGQRCETAELTNDGKKIFAGYGDGNIKLWDIKNTQAIVDVKSDNPLSHTECVSDVSCDAERSLYLSGSEDGKILITSNSGPVGILDPAAGPVECVAFSPDTEHKLAASATLQGQIAIWDVAKQTIRAVCENDDVHVHNGVTTLKWLPELTILCGTIRGSIIGFDGRNGVKKFSLEGHAAEVYEMFYDSKRGILLTASEDKTAKLFKGFL